MFATVWRVLVSHLQVTCNSLAINLQRNRKLCADHLQLIATNCWSQLTTSLENQLPYAQTIECNLRQLSKHWVPPNDFEAILNNFWTTPPTFCPEWGRVGQNHMVIPLEGCQRNSREGLFKASTRLYAVLGWSPSRPHGRANITVFGVSFLGPLANRNLIRCQNSNVA